MMNTFLITVLAALSAATSNFFFRKNSDQESGYLLNFYLISFVISFFLFPDVFDTPWNTKVVLLGSFVGLLNFLLMQSIAKALQTGPSGLTFVFQNVSSIFPGLLLFILFGQQFGFEYSLYQLIGICLVVAGVVIGSLAQKKDDRPPNKAWFLFAFSSLAIQVFALSLIQWRCLLFKCTLPEHALIPWSLDPELDVYFMPAQFGTAFLLQLIDYCNKKESLKNYGLLGGLFNGISTFLLLIATKMALPWESTILFPIFAAGVIVLCNLWAWKFYREKFDISSNLLCTFGILIGSYH